MWKEAVLLTKWGVWQRNIWMKRFIRSIEKKIVVEGINGKVFFINESQILYVEAKLRNCDIFMQNGEVIHGKDVICRF